MTRRKPKPVAADSPPADSHPADTSSVSVEPAVADNEPVAEHPPAHHRPDEHSAAGHPVGGSSHAEAVRPDGPRVPNPFGHKQDAAAGVRLLEDRRFKQVQLKFADKPPEAVRKLVSEAGFRWLQEEQAWAKQIDKEKGWQTRAEAEGLFDRVAAMIRAEKGIAREHA